MIRRISMAIAGLVTVLGFSAAHAQYDEPVSDVQPMVAGSAYNCRLEGNIKGGSIAIGIGGQVLKGNGEITCRNNTTGEVLVQPVKLRLAGAGIGFEISRIKSVQVVTAGIAVNDPRYFFDNFSVGAEAGASLARQGISFDAAIRLAGESGLGFDVGFQGREILGLGAHLYAMAFRITPR